MDTIFVIEYLQQHYNKMPRKVTIVSSPTVAYISPSGSLEPVGPRASNTRRTNSGNVKRKEVIATRYWTETEALEFLESSGYADLWRRNVKKSDRAQVNAEIARLAQLMSGKVRRRGHERNLDEKLEDFEALLRDPDSTFTDLRQIVLSGGE
jgi:hypothetical protein